jgi:hypothetical protein
LVTAYAVNEVDRGGHFNETRLAVEQMSSTDDKRWPDAEILDEPKVDSAAPLEKMSSVLIYSPLSLLWLQLVGVVVNRFVNR